MSFRQHNETKRKWLLFWRANKELIEQIGLPDPTVDTWDRFADLLMHGYIDHHSDPSRFNIRQLQPDKFQLFRSLVNKYFEAGFPDPGITALVVGGQRERMALVRKYPQQFDPMLVKMANERIED